LEIAKVCDFGSSRVQSTAGTMTGNIGTLVYMSPEVLLNKPYDDRCDVYSFGIIMHEMYFEIRPYTTDEFGNLFVRIHIFLTIFQNLGYQVISGSRPIVPTNLQLTEAQHAYIELMKRCWDPEPLSRPSMGETYEELERISNM
jgi:serine/threonine protein kinase